MSRSITEPGPEAKNRKSVLTAICLALLSITLLLITARSTGLTWDEPTYFIASESYVGSLGRLVTDPAYALSEQGVREYWEANHEHPPFDKVWSGLAWAASRYIFDDLTAHRLGNILLSGILIALVYLMVAADYGNFAGLAAAAALLTMPRFFFHAHLAALDVPVAVMIFLAGFVFMRTKDRPGLKWIILLGLVIGLSLGTKINALFTLPIVLALWTIIFQKKRLHQLARLVFAGIIGIIVFMAIWPWLYHDTWNRLREYFNFMTVDHYTIAQYYFGNLHMPPGWHYPFVITLIVVPLTLTILYLLGAFRALRGGRSQGPAWFYILGALVPLLILATGKSQVFDNERLFMPAFPYLAALSGVGFDWLLGVLNKLSQSHGWPALVKPLGLGLAFVVFLPHIVLALNLYPNLLSYYSEAIFGLRGARRLRMETTYWCDTYQASLPYLNDYAPQNAIVWAECYDVMLYYQSQGKLRSDLRITGGTDTKPANKNVPVYTIPIEDSDIAVIQYRQSGFYRPIRNWLRGREPVFERDRQGIRLMGVFTH